MNWHTTGNVIGAGKGEAVNRRVRLKMMMPAPMFRQVVPLRCWTQYLEWMQLAVMHTDAVTGRFAMAGAAKTK